MERRKLIVFGVGDILLDGKMGGLKDTLVILGKEREVKRIDEEYRRRKFIGPGGLEELAELYRGFSKKELKKIALDYCKQNIARKAKATISKLKKRGYLVGALSANPQFVMESLQEILSLDFSEGTEIEFIEGMATGRILKKVDRYTRAQILKEKISQLGLKRQDVVVVGGSITDVPMAQEAGLFIAFDGLEDVEKEADIIVKEDLTKILKYI